MSRPEQNPDVIIIGAGTAGLAAAKALRVGGLKTVVLEAAGHVGGRCFTDAQSFSVPFDHGASWLHSAPINPLARLAEAAGVQLHKTPWRWRRVLALGHDLTPAEVQGYQCYQDRMWRELRCLGAAEDGKILDALPVGRWRETAKHYVAQMLSADADVTSIRDVQNYADAPGDWLVGGGLGTFIAGLHSDVPVVLNCPVSKVDYSGAQVRVTTSHGELMADHVIITVSTSVLAAGVIKFTPELPIEKQAAIAALPTGVLNKIAIDLDPAWRDASEGDMVDYHSGDAEFCSIQFGFFGTNMAMGFVAGRFAETLEADGPKASTAYCIEALTAMFGSGVAKVIKRTKATSWRNNPIALGSYSYAIPGHSPARGKLADPIEDRLFFAGEATMQDTYSTVHGAYQSGLRAAGQVFLL